MIWTLFIFAAIFGACIGSFLNVVIYRLPEGLSILNPKFSFCPSCKHQLAAEDNIPVLAWFWLKGKCRYCAAPISKQYPIIEGITAALFALVFAVYYLTPLRPDFSNETFDGVAVTWPVLAVHLFLIAALFAGTIIDYRHYVIPMGIPWCATIAAAVILPLSTIPLPLSARYSGRLDQVWPVADGAMLGVAIGGGLGLLISLALLHLRVLPRSFNEDEFVPEKSLEAPTPAPLTGDAPTASPAEPATATPATPRETPIAASADAGASVSTPSPAPAATAEATPLNDPDNWYVHPFPVREVFKEARFVLIPILTGLLGWWIAYKMTSYNSQPIIYVRVLMGVLLGYLVGGGMVWITRIIGTIAFRKEAMGLGDVHLLAAIGAVVGPMDAVVIFFLAAILGLVGAVALYGINRVAQGKVRIIAFGPYLALATLVMMLLHDPITNAILRLFPR